MWQQQAVATATAGTTKQQQFAMYRSRGSKLKSKASNDNEEFLFYFSGHMPAGAAVNMV